MKQKRIYMRSGSRPSSEATTLLCAVNPMICPADEQQKDDKNRRSGRKINQEEGKDRKPKPTVDRNEVAGLFACCLGVIRCDHGMIHREYPISCDITRYETSRCRIHIPNFEDWPRYIVSRRNISRYRTLVSTTQAWKGSCVQMKAYKNMETKHRLSTDDDGVKHYCALPKVTSKRMAEGVNEESIGMSGWKLIFDSWLV